MRYSDYGLRAHRQAMPSSSYLARSADSPDVRTLGSYVARGKGRL